MALQTALLRQRCSPTRPTKTYVYGRALVSGETLNAQRRLPGPRLNSLPPTFAQLIPNRLPPVEPIGAKTKPADPITRLLLSSSEPTGGRPNSIAAILARASWARAT